MKGLSNLPPGCTQRMIDAQFADGPCAVCAKCCSCCICPECPTCGESGNPACYTKAKLSSHTLDPGSCFNKEGNHGLRLKLSREQAIGRAEARVYMIREQLTDQEQLVAYLKQGAEFSNDISDNPDPWG